MPNCSKHLLYLSYTGHNTCILSNYTFKFDGIWNIICEVILVPTVLQGRTIEPKTDNKVSVRAT